MAYQLEIIRFRDILPVLSIPRFLPGIDPPTLEIVGEDFTSAERVIINGTPVPEFMIASKQSIYAQVPTGMKKMSTIEVISSRFTRSVVSSKISFEIGDQTLKVNGLLKLVQLFVKWILQSPGSDVLNPSRGGGLQDLIGRVSTTRNMQPIYATITRAIDTTVSQIKTAQAAVGDLPLDERLMSAVLIDMSTFQDRMEARARIGITSIAGIEAVTALRL